MSTEGKQYYEEVYSILNNGRKCPKYVTQDLRQNHVTENGIHQMISKGYNLYTRWTSAAGFTISCNSYPNGEKEYILNITLNEGKLQISKGCKLLLKFQDGTIIELENRKEIGPSDYSYRVGQTGTDYFVYPEYPLTEENIKQLVSQAAIKIRIGTNQGYIDRDLKKAKLQKAFIEALNSFSTSTPEENDFNSNF